MVIILFILCSNIDIPECRVQLLAVALANLLTALLGHSLQHVQCAVGQPGVVAHQGREGGGSVLGLGRIHPVGHFVPVN